MNQIKILLFATLRDRLGAKMLELKIPDGMTVAGLKEVLVKTYPQLALAQKSMMVAINLEYAADDELVPSGAEIGLFPPVSGG
jgi:sulfur-carrier protein